MSTGTTEPHSLFGNLQRPLCNRSHSPQGNNPASLAVVGLKQREEPVSAPKPPSDHLRHGNSTESQSATGSAVVDKRTTWPGLEMDF